MLFYERIEKKPVRFVVPNEDVAVALEADGVRVEEDDRNNERIIYTDFTPKIDQNQMSKIEKSVQKHFFK